MHGAPAQLRVKTYSASTGVVYQYFYSGYRETKPRSEDTGADVEYVFQATTDRKHYHPVSVIVTGNALAEWSKLRGRRIVESERYAIAKMSLFAAFDHEDTPLSAWRAICPDAKAIDLHLETLGRV